MTAQPRRYYLPPAHAFAREARRVHLAVLALAPIGTRRLRAVAHSRSFREFSRIINHLREQRMIVLIDKMWVAT